MYATNGLCSCRIAYPISMGDGNLFAQRNFKQDRHSDFRSCILIDLLERILNQLNESRDQLTRITYNVVSNTQAGEHIKSLQGATNPPVIVFLPYPCVMANKPLLLRIVRLENPTKQMSLLFPMRCFLATLNSQNAFWCTTCMGLRDSGCDFQSPLLSIASLRAMKNKRHRTQAAENRSLGRYQQRDF